MFRKERIHVICNELKKLSCTTFFDITKWKKKEGFYLRPQDAENSKVPWQDFDSKNMMWMGKDQHYWFTTEFTVPEEFSNNPLYLIIKTQIDEADDMSNPQFLAFINNIPVQGVDMNHREILISENAEPNKKYKIDLQAYTGTLHVELLLIGRVVQINKQILKSYYDFNVPLCIAEKLEDGNSIKMSIELELEKAADLLDMRIPYSKDFYDSIKSAEDYLEKTVYETLAGNSQVIASCIGHTHIDVAWLWTVNQTKEKVARSFSTVLKLMEEYPEYKFMSSQPQLYEFLKDRYPEIYENVKERISEKRWEPEGGMWVEADCNLTSGESLVRQFLYGKKFFKEEFGVDSKLLWLPDVFGYSAALPQIMKKCGIEYFMTTKIAWNEFNKFPYDTFWWYGIDGTPIFTHLITTKGVDQDKESFFTTYNGILHPAALMGGWDRYQQKEINNDILVCYGYGDGGGGPTREMLETGRRLEKGISGAPKAEQKFSKDYFDKIYSSLAHNPDVPKWIGELYLEYHRGTYTSMARNKRSNRKSEFALMNLEMLSVWAEKYGMPYPKEEIDSLWKTILINQFHDILPGSAIKEAYDVTKLEYEEIKNKAETLTNERLDLIASKLGACDDKIAIFNTLSFKRSDKIILNDFNANATELISEDGDVFPLQKDQNGMAAAWVKDIPPKGLKILRFNEGKIYESPFNIRNTGIETPYYKISIDSSGFFTSLFDKSCNREVLKNGEKGNVFRVYEDKPREYDNWNIDIYYSRKSWLAYGVTKFEWIENGPVHATLLTERTYCNSLIRQKIYFYANSKRIDFETYVDWKEHQQLMKVEFPIDVNANEAAYDIQFGNLTRPTHSNTSWDKAKFEVCAHKWADLSDGGYGVSLLNDCKYGYGIRNQLMTLSLIKSGIEPNLTTDQEEHWFTYSLLPHKGNWKDGCTVNEAYMLNLPLLISRPNRRITVANKVTSLIDLNAENIILETIKKAEDGNGTIIRIYEFENKLTEVKAHLSMDSTKVIECNLLEEDISCIAEKTNEFSFTIKPYEIKTFRIV